MKRTLSFTASRCFPVFFHTARVSANYTKQLGLPRPRRAAHSVNVPSLLFANIHREKILADRPRYTAPRRGHLAAYLTRLLVRFHNRLLPLITED